MLAEQDHAGLKEVCGTLHPADLADVLDEMPPATAWEVLRHGTPAQQAEVLPYLSVPLQMGLVEVVERQQLSKIVEEMSADDRVDLLREMDDDHVAALMPLIAQAERDEIRKLLSYPEESAGAIMTTEYASLPADISIHEALDRLRIQAPSRETIYYIYITDDQRHLQGFLSLRKLIQARPSARLADVMERDVISVKVTEDREAVANTMQKYGFIAIPVVDEENRLVGIVTHDDAADVLQEEATEDAHLAAAVQPLDEDYLEAGFWTIWRKRAMWLSCLFVAELFTFTALAQYEDEIASIIALSLFVPLCISTGGNSGSQAATLITRAMALGQVSPRQWWLVLRKELLMGAALGVALGAIGYMRGLTTPQSILDGSQHREAPFEVYVPEGLKIQSAGDAVRLPVGSLITQEPLQYEAVVTLPAGHEFSMDVNDTTGGTSYHFPAGAEIRYPMPIRWTMALVIGQAVAAICLWGTLVGSMLPLIFRRLGADPGYASSPFVATFVDVTGIVIYFTIAKMYLL